MNYDELYAEIQLIIESIAEKNPSVDLSDCSHLLDHGESQEAMDVLIATAVRFNLSVSERQRDKLSELMNEFDLTDGAKATYRYLSDAEMLDRMIVVDESGSS